MQPSMLPFDDIYSMPFYALIIVWASKLTTLYVTRKPMVAEYRLLVHCLEFKIFNHLYTGHHLPVLCLCLVLTTFEQPLPYMTGSLGF